LIPIYRDPPSGTKNPSPADRLEVVYNGYVLNSAAGTADNQIELVQTAVTPITDQVIENKQGRDGMEVYQAFKSGLSIRLQGWIKKPTLMALLDEAALMSEKFDAALLSRRFQTSTIGFQPLAFNVPTADGANYPGNLVSSFYLARTMEPITFGRTKYDGYAMPFRIDMIARDPSRFFSTQQMVAPVSSGPIGADNTLGRYPSWPTWTFTMTGPGSAADVLTNAQAFGGSKQLTLNLSTLVNGDVVKVDFEQRRIFVNGVLRMSLYVSGVYWQIEPRIVNNISLSSQFNMTARTLTWYRAFPV
jgi:hypothetical protein